MGRRSERAAQAQALGNVKIQTDIQRTKRQTAREQAAFLSQLFSRAGQRGGLSAFFTEQLGFAEPGQVATAQLANQEIAQRRQLEGLFQQRGLLGSGAELAAQAQLGVGFAQARAQSAAETARERLAREAALQQQLLGRASGAVGSVGGVNPAAIAAIAPRTQSALPGALGALGGKILGVGFGGKGKFFENIGTLFDKGDGGTQVTGTAGNALTGAAGGAIQGALTGGPIGAVTGGILGLLQGFSRK